MKKLLLANLLWVWLLPTAMAQQQVSGKVTDYSTGEPLPGVNILVKGTTTGTISDIQGNYSMSVSGNDAVLVFSFIGYETYEVAVGAQRTINAQLMPDLTTLEEVVVVGYGTMKRSDLTGAVASVDGETLTRTVSSGVDQALIGRVAGITATQMSGQPGASVSIRIRGTSSVNGDVEPLYVIDGVPISGNGPNVYTLGLGAVGGGGKTTFSPLSTLNPNDIESIEVLKDASATAIYGNRGSNGVVIITTKRGKKGQARINYEGYYGVQEMTKRLDMMNLREYASFRKDWAAETAGQVPDPLLADPSILGEGTDWQSEIFQTAPIQSHQISLSGGGDKTRFIISGGYFNQDGVIIGSGFERYSLRVNLDADLKDWLTIGNSIAVSKTDEKLGQFDRGGVIQTALKARPDVPARNFDGSYAGKTGEGAFVNPLAQALDRENYLKRAQVLGNIFADIKIIPALTLRTEFGGNADLSNTSSWNPMYDYGMGAINEQNSISKQNNTSYFWQIKNYLTFNKRLLESHNITAMIGQEASEWGWNSLSGTGKGLPTNDVHAIRLSEEDNQTASDAANSGALESYFGRLNYNFNEKYYFTLTYRADGHSNFSEGNKWGYFPSAAVKWRLINEPFMRTAGSFVSDLSLRAGWGQTGNAGTQGGFRYGASMATLPTNLGLGFRVSNNANPLLTWETAEQIDLGLDAAFINNRVQFSLDFYRKLVKDLLLRMPLPGYMGSIGNESIALIAPWGNFGELENKGFEIEISTKNLTGDFKWETDFNFTRNINELIDLGIKDAPLTGSIGAAGNVVISRTLNGMQLGSFYGYKVAGIFKDKEDILNSPVQYSESEGEVYFSRDGTVWPGDLKFVDIDGNDTIDIRDRTFLGSPQPKFTFGFNNTFSYKGFELGVFLVGTYGNKIFNAMKQSDGGGLGDMKSAWNNQLEEVKDRAKLEPVGEAVDGWWDDIDNVQVSNPGTDIPRATYADPNRNTRISDRYIEDGSYLRIRNISLAYNFSSEVAERLKVGGLRVYAKVQNAYTFTKYSGYDPEVGQDTWDPNLFGVDNGRYPSPRTYTLGVSVDF